MTTQVNDLTKYRLGRLPAAEAWRTVGAVIVGAGLPIPEHMLAELVNAIRAFEQAAEVSGVVGVAHVLPACDQALTADTKLARLELHLDMNERVLRYIGARGGRDEHRAATAVVVLLSVAKDALQYMVERHDWPLAHAVPELERLSDLVVALGETLRAGKR